MQYYLSDRGDQRGPFTFEQLRAMWGHGMVTGDTFYWQEGAPEWLPLADMAEKLEARPPARSNRSHGASGAAQSANTAKQMLALLGSALLFVGAFCPSFSGSLSGGISYVENGMPESIVILGLAAGSTALAIGGRYRLLWLTGLSELAALAITLYHFQDSAAQERRHSQVVAGGNIAAPTWQLEWGMAVLLVGVFLVLLAAAIPGKENGRGR